MFLSSAVSVLQATPTQVIVSIPPDRTVAYVGIPICVFLLLGAMGLAGTHRYRAILLTLAACGGIGASINSWRSHTEIGLSRVEGTATIEKSSLFGQSTESYALVDIRTAVVDVGADASKRIDFILASGETVHVGNYEQRQGFESAVVALNGLLSGPGSPATQVR